MIEQQEPFFYSASTRGFYLSSIHGADIPDDAVEVTTEQRRQILETAAGGEDLPVSCSPWQIRKALNQLGLRGSVEQAVASAGDVDLSDGWEFATEFRSDAPFVLAIGAALGKTPEETKEIIVLASGL